VVSDEATSHSVAADSVLLRIPLVFISPWHNVQRHRTIGVDPSLPRAGDGRNQYWYGSCGHRVSVASAPARRPLSALRVAGEGSPANAGRAVEAVRCRVHGQAGVAAGHDTWQGTLSRRVT
jgi:hypothetical protein